MLRHSRSTKHVVSPGAFALHADCNAVADKRAGEGSPVNCKP
jgi:hypothetical protein